MRKPLFPEGATATFADYFQLNAETEDVLAELGFSFRLENCELPRKEVDQNVLAELKQRLERVLPHVSLGNEAARREFLIAPVLTEVAFLTGAKIRVEFPLKVDDRLQGNVDYFVRAKHNVLVVEAKKADLERGLTQLAVELVALDRWLEDSTESRLYGAVSVGNVWQFGFLDRAEKRFTQDLNTYSVPTVLKEVVEILDAILTE